MRPFLLMRSLATRLLAGCETRQPVATAALYVDTLTQQLRYADTKVTY